MYKQTVKRINDSKYKIALALAGGGQSFPYHFMQFGGASKTIADIRIPYGKEAFEEFCGGPVTKFVSEETARLLAVKSYVNCCKSVDPKYAVGVGLTCSLATNDEREGREHRIILAIHWRYSTDVISVTLQQGLTREQEEELCRNMIFEELLWKCTPYEEEFVHESQYSRVGYRKTCTCGPSRINCAIPDDEHNVVVMPGSYNPFHAGHKEMAELAREILGVPVHLELTVVNADKGMLDNIEVDRRLSTIEEGYKTIVTDARTFLDKARLFKRDNKQLTFVVGADTWNRILDPKYAGEMPELYAQLSDLNVRFLVFPRNGDVGQDNYHMNKLRLYDHRTNLHNSTLSSTAIREGN